MSIDVIAKAFHLNTIRTGKLLYSRESAAESIKMKRSGITMKKTAIAY